MSIKLHEFYYTEVKEGEFRSMRTAAGWSLMALLQPFPTFHCIISYAFVFALSLVTTLSSPPCFYFFHLFPPSSLCLSLSLSLSLSIHYWYRTHLWISLVSTERMTFPLSSFLPLLFICLLHLYSFPSGYSADKVSLHSTNGSITLVLFFTACPGKLLLNGSSILQHNCPGNSILCCSFQ